MVNNDMPLRVCRFCGLEALSENDLNSFVKNKKSPYGRRTICKTCDIDRRAIRAKRKIIVPLKPKKPLRACNVCGLKALTETDLEIFVKNNQAKYKRLNLCKKCSHKPSTPVHMTHENRRKFYLEYWDKPLICHFCNKKITKLRGQDSDSLDIHSLDGNHENWEPENKAPTHTACHISHHQLNQSDEAREKKSIAMMGRKNPAWKHGGYEGVKAKIRLRRKKNVI